MQRWVGRLAMVTGASAGIGAAIAQQLVCAGLRVVGLARRGDCMQKMAEDLKDAPGKLFPIKADLTKENDILAAFQWVKDNHGGVDVMVNNAAIAPSSFLIDEIMMMMARSKTRVLVINSDAEGRRTLADVLCHMKELAVNAPDPHLVLIATLADGNTSDWKDILNVNVIALSVCTREALKSMKERSVDDGHIIHINSMTGHYAGNLPAVYMYSASKHAVLMLTEGLRRELVRNGSSIRVTSISPGAVDTDMMRGALVPEHRRHDLPMLLPKDVADAVLFAVSAPPHMQVHEMMIHPTGERY